MIHDPITVLPSVGQKRYEILRNAMGIDTIRDLLFYTPYRYVDQSRTVAVASCREDDLVTVTGTITSVRITGHKRNILDITLSDESGSIDLLFFGGIRYYAGTYSEGMQITASGRVTRRKTLQIVHPDIEEYGSEHIHTGRIVPVYSIPTGVRKHSITTKYIRKLIYHALDYCTMLRDDPHRLPYYEKNGLMPFSTAIRQIHFPDTLESASHARLRLAYDELLSMQLVILWQKQQRCNIQADLLTARERLFDDYSATLPFTLTDDQKSCCAEISDDLSGRYPMNRLLQGDVGSGKTAVAAFAVYCSHHAGRQSSFMAPTELLATQHYDTLTKLLPGIPVALLTGRTPPSRRKEILAGVADGSLSCLVGTHALIQSDVGFKSLSLAVIDEQHRFGLEQRVQLRRKNEATHLLNMSATPIPRTMAITLYGDMDISRIREKPCGRLPVKTLVMSEARKGAVFNSMEKYIRQGRQCYYVVPMIEPNDDLELESVESAYAEICERFRAENCALMHGRLSAEQKQDIMSRFSGGEVSVLVSTTVIEVGIDVPNATVIVIRHPERFGLAQLHQLRGRVGRGTEQSFCVLLHDEDIGEAARERLDILEKSDDGFEIAEKDLSLRGAGTLTGSVQSGFSSEFIFADIYADVDLLCQAREDAEELIRSTDAAVIRKLSDASGAAAILS